MTATVGPRVLPPVLPWELSVPLYRFHLYNSEETRDEEGRSFENLDAACAHAAVSARAIMASDIQTEGEITLSHWIEVETEEGDMHVVTFGDTVTINP